MGGLYRFVHIRLLDKYIRIIINRALSMGDEKVPLNNSRSKITPRNNSAPKQKKRTSAGGLAAVGLRNDFYTEGYKKMIIISMLSMACLIGSVGLVFYAAQKTEKNVYFATDANGSLIKLVPLSAPNHSDAVISDWLTRALIETFDFHYGNLERKLNESALKWFTPNGATELITALDDSNNFESIRERSMFVQLALKHAPIVVKSGKPSWSRYYLWKLQVEGVMTYRTISEEFSNTVIFTVVVSRRSMLEDPTGLGVAKIIMTIK